ncbi:MAG: DUF2786 domain-containing protein [Treponema sp.]|jgi:hypothetical protein|nr:DUF2786 domain-containing protein [Treponema sp.]
MTTDIDKIKDRIKKLFALSKSPNANEAAAALEMAQRLMDEYRLIKNEIPTLDVNEDEMPRASGFTPPQYEINLAVSIAEAFGCKVLMSRTLDKQKLIYRNTYKYIGIDYRPEVASYIATVLFRKLHRARTDYLKSLYRVRSRGTKIKRGDEFSKGWVSIVTKKLKNFTSTPEEKMALEMYMKKFANLEKVEGIDREGVKKYEYLDWQNGYESGACVEIQHGIKGKKNDTNHLEKR